MISIIKKALRPHINRYRTQKKIKQRRQEMRQQAQKAVETGDPVRLIIGAGGTDYPGWIKTDLPYLDVLKSSDWEAVIVPGTVDRVLAEHVFEHLTPDQFKQFLAIIRDYLKPDGFVRIAVPDGHHPNPDYIEQVRPGGRGLGADDHKVLYTLDSLSTLLDDANYQYRPLEYFDSRGQFHQIEWISADGMVNRSADHDRRNRETPLSYTSLIVDLWPKK